MSSSQVSNTYYKTVNVKKLDVNDYNKRIENYKNLLKLFKNFNENKCLVTAKRKINNNETSIIKRSYYLGDTQIFLKKRMGNNSRYGTIFLSTYNNNKFAIKLSPITHQNFREIILIKKLSKITEEDKNPHFILNYKFFICNNKLEITDLPRLIQKNDYYININELVNGTFKDFLNFTSSILLLNALQQILIAILSFHYFTNGYFHNDCHSKNFLYLKIKPGGYFHYRIYNKDIYIKNLGFIWFIWDFGLVRTREKYIKRKLEDYFRILYGFLKYENYNSNSNNTIVIKSVLKILKFKKNYKSFFGNSDKLFFEELFKIPKLFNYTIPSMGTIINKNPYIIE